MLDIESHGDIGRFFEGFALVRRHLNGDLNGDSGKNPQDGAHKGNSRSNGETVHNGHV